MVAPEEPDGVDDKNSARLRSITAEVLEVDPADIDMGAHFYDDLGASSLEKAEILGRIEREFAVRLTDGSVENLDSLDDALVVVGTAGGAGE
ncbi:acyl carrier protein [Nocardia aurantia]|uniref:Acyl carrier protein n=1 Tax=Nocardia aurantia TaxID=2585199 RepID=A0A7K0E3M0_9NOCA|nr:acyl carrier protein [Nocardia aurantia]MQY31744.1 Acyl carrier protein [Nocardia aurantia]